MHERMWDKIYKRSKIILTQLARQANDQNTMVKAIQILEGLTEKLGEDD